MSSEDPRERDDLCGRELAGEGIFKANLAEEYDPKTWYEAEDGTHYCRRDVWDGADDGRCIWHADVTDKPADELVASLSGDATRLDRAILRQVEFPDGVDFAGCRLREADFNGARLANVDLSDASLLNADLRGGNLGDADLGNADLTSANLSGANLWDADLVGAVLSGADLSQADLWNADLRDAELDSADLGGANLRLASLSRAVLFGTSLCGANLEGAKFDSTILQDVDISGAYLGETSFPNSQLRNVDLASSKFRHTTFEDATFDEATTFGTASGYENTADDTAEDASRLASHVSPRFRALGRPSTNSDPLELAETQYRTIQRLRREHDLKQDPALEIQEKHARRKRALTERRYWDWFKLAIYRWPMGYGEKPWHVVGTSLAVILASALLYPLAGIRVDGAERTYPAVLADPAGTAVETVRVVAESVYFSTVTFTTLGYGDVEPVGWAKALSTVESFVGALLMALLVFVLGRRATW